MSLKSWRLLLSGLLASALLMLLVPSFARSSQSVSARLGISAGDAIADLPPGTTGPALEQRLLILFETAARLGLRIETVSVGQGFYLADGEVLSERDLDLVVSGPREDINTLGAILGKAWDQSTVFVWYARPDGSTATAAVPLPGGADTLTDEIYRELVGELVDGGHVRYAGADSLLFVANTGEESDEAFAEQMDRVRDLLERAGVRTGPLQLERADMVVLDRATYDEYVERRAA